MIQNAQIMVATIQADDCRCAGREEEEREQTLNDMR
jgi:hypothetical protein